jgi:hypothetical protein
MSDLDLTETACKQVYFPANQENAKGEYRVPSMAWSFVKLRVDQNLMLESGEWS